ncbi:uncharacterized protein C3orf20 homolog [Rousettus aegyptiacus]|uniref:uncharacterized protein C3orf20 homolog n=1 Tax=Rousettus aegyptiacus TaxID=9407 RepID=UPI00168D50B0|nr:uncharacterized protein C3orf20 homolog [Rousettus aegyptiacus]
MSSDFQLLPLMEDYTDAKLLDIGPLYFFEQRKPKRKKWEKRKCKDDFPCSTYTSQPKDSYLKIGESKKLEEEARLSIVTDSEKKYEIRSFDISRTPFVSKFSAKSKLSKIYLQKCLLEEYKLIAAEMLYELGEMLQKYAEYNITFPVGIANLVNYSWHDLTAEAYKCATRNSMLKKHNASQSRCNSMIVDDKISCCSREEYDKKNHLAKSKIDHAASSKCMEKTSLISQNQCFQISQDSSLPAIIHFSLTSKICFENGWIFQQPYSKSEILKWKTILGIAVKKLQGAIIQIKTEKAKLMKEGFNKRLILSHYNDTEDKVKLSKSPQHSHYFWLELLKWKPPMPTVKEADPHMKKFHYALIDGSSVTYYPSGRLAICQSYSALPWGGVYTNIFSDLPHQVILGTFTPFGCGSISFSNGPISMMFNQDGGMVISKKGNVVREWMWPSKGKLDDPVEIWVNKFITVEIFGRFAINLVYEWDLQSLKLSLAPVKFKSSPPCFPEVSLADVNPVSKKARELFKAYEVKCKQMKSTTQVKDSSNITGLEDTATFDLAMDMDISPLTDIATAIKLRRLRRKAKHILFNWLDHYRFALGIESLNICKVNKFPRKVVRKQVSPEFPLNQSAKEKDEEKEYLRYRNTFLKLKGVFKPSPLCRIQKTPASNQSFRLPLPIESKDTSFASQLVCPVVLRRTLCGQEGDTCRCSAYSIPEVTDLEYDHLISTQLSPVDQIIIVYVISSKEKDETLKEVAKVYRKQNRMRSMPCVQSHLDSFRFLKYIISASKFTGISCPLLVQRHNVIPGIFLMYIQGKLLFANFIFNGYSTSAEDLQKQIVKTRSDYHMGYFLPDDFKIR